MRWTAVIVLDAPAGLSASHLASRVTGALASIRPEIITESVTLHSGTVYHGPVHPGQRWEDHHQPGETHTGEGYPLIER